jgi:predicted DNA-binding WGR domain protein
MNTVETRYVEFVEGTSAKFYRIAVIEDGGAYKTLASWGRIGTAGQQGIKYAGPDLAAATAALNAAYREKTGKGYADAADPLEA